MPLSVQSATANCGVSTPGTRFTNLLTELNAKELDALDVFFLHCQETHAKDTIDEINQVLENTGYKLTCSDLMITHTKPKVFLSNSTGMLTIAIHKSDITVDFATPIESRRSEKLSLFDNGFNKGGMITRTIITKGEQKYTVDNLSAHLESFDASNRVLDWRKLYHAYHPVQCHNFSQLTTKIPDMLTIGMDSNVRDFTNGESPWSAQGLMEAYALTNASLANELYSNGETTYKSDNKDNKTKQSKKRPGRIQYGQLDIVGYLGSETLKSDIDFSLIEDIDFEELEDTVANPLLRESKRNSVITLIDPSHDIDLKNNDSDRDHHIIIAPEKRVAISDEVYRVQKFIAQSLHSLSPEFATKISALDSNSEATKSILLNLYNDFIASGDSVLQQLLWLEQQKLHLLEHKFKNRAHIHYYPSIVHHPLLKEILYKLSDSSHFWRKAKRVFEIALKIEQEILPFYWDGNNNNEQKVISVLITQCFKDILFLIEHDSNLNDDPEKFIIEPLSQLLFCNHQLHNYKTHLDSIKKDTPGATAKIERIVSPLCNAILAEGLVGCRLQKFKSQVKSIHKNQNQLITTHRDQKFWHIIFRALKRLFSSAQCHPHSHTLFGSLTQNLDIPPGGLSSPPGV